MEKRGSSERDQLVRKHGSARGTETLKEVNEVGQGKRARRQGWLKHAAEKWAEVAILRLWFGLSLKSSGKSLIACVLFLEKSL